jgi:Cu-Zn family superoxide dismutase
MAVAVFNQPSVKGEVAFISKLNGTEVRALFTRLPHSTREHGFHIHRAGDLRGEGCAGLCEHFHKGSPKNHGGPPHSHFKGERHTGDLGNIVQNTPYTFFLKGVSVEELFGRSIIVHEDADDYGKGDHEDSLTTGHSGKRVGCAIIGRTRTCDKKRKTVKVKKH